MNRNISCLIITSLLLISLDRFTKKLIILQNLPHQQNTSLFFFNVPIPLIVAISIIIFFLIFLWLKNTYKQKNHLLTLALLLILTGGLSNFYDRLVLGNVTDWIYLPFFPFLSFNLADTYITAGTILALFSRPQTH